MSENADMANRVPRTKPSKSDLLPVDWPAIEPHYKAGILSVNAISKRFGVSRKAIDKHAAKQVPPWTRNPNPAILARAEELVASKSNTSLVASGAPTAGTVAAQEAAAAVIEASAEALAIVLMGHRSSITRAARITNKLMAELEELIDRPELAHMVFDALSLSAHNDGIGPLADLARLVTSLPERARALKTLLESLGIVVSLERTSYGMGGKDDEGGLPEVIVRDFTGKGSTEASTRKQTIRED